MKRTVLPLVCVVAMLCFASPSQAAEPVLKIAGRVLDSETGKEIAKCRMVPTNVYGSATERVTWQSQYLKEFTDGRFVYQTDRPWEQTMLRIEAEGYRPAITRVVTRDEKAVEFDVKLTPQRCIGVVLLPDGKPAAKTQLAVATHTNEVQLEIGKLSYSGHGAKLRKVVETNEKGEFELPAECDPAVVVATHETGYVEQTLIGMEVNGKPVQPGKLTIKLQAWGGVKGRILKGDKPVAGVKLWVYPARRDNVFVSGMRTVTSDAEGRFAVEKTPPGMDYTCQRIVEQPDGKGSHSISGLIAKFQVSPGKTTEIELGGKGHTVIGKLTLPAGLEFDLDWSKVNLRVFPRAPHFGGPGDAEFWSTYSMFLSSDEGKVYSRDKVAVMADGSFRIEGLPAADYQLVVNIPGAAAMVDPKPERDILRGGISFDVPPTPPSATKLPTVTLNEIKLTLVPPPKMP